MYPKLFTIGTFYLPTYGLLVALGFLAALFLALRLARRAGLDAEKVSNLAVYAALVLSLIHISMLCPGLFPAPGS